MKFTVLTPTYNRDYLLANSIQSILDQNFQDFEMLIVDDGSTDMTRKIVADFQKIDKRVKYVKLKTHQGLVSALQMGNELAQGEIITKHDSDDLSLPNRLAKIDNYFREHPETEFFYSGMYQTWHSEDGNTLRREYFPALPLTERILKEQYISGCFAYTKKFIAEVPYRQLNCSEDWMLILDAYLKKRNIGYLDEGLYEYYLHPDSNSLRWEGTGGYEADEKTMREILKNEYGFKGFKYAERK